MPPLAWSYIIVFILTLQSLMHAVAVTLYAPDVLVQSLAMELPPMTLIYITMSLFHIENIFIQIGMEYRTTSVWNQSMACVFGNLFNRLMCCIHILHKNTFAADAYLMRQWVQYCTPIANISSNNNNQYKLPTLFVSDNQYIVAWEWEILQLMKRCKQLKALWREY